MRIAITQLAVTLVAVAYAGFALLSGLDRLADDESALPAVIDWPYARGAPYNAALAAARKRQWGQAQTLVTRALYTDPVNEGIIGGLATMRLYAGNTAGADAAFRVSVQRGWRDPATHLYWMGKSIDVADFATAATHADALLRGAVAGNARAHLVDPLLEYDEGRNALALRLRSHPSWANEFAYGIDNLPTAALQARADVIARAGRGIWNCAATTGLIDRLVLADDPDDGRRVHDASCSESGAQTGTGGNFVNDARFFRMIGDGRASLLDWRAPESGDIAINPGKDTAGHPYLRLRVSMPARTLVLTQLVPLHAGTYTVSWQMPETKPDAIGGLEVTLDCNSNLSDAVTGTPVPGNPNTFAAKVRFSGECPTAVLGFWVAPSKDLTIADVGLSRSGV